jgi:hypothetical protein
MTLTIVLFVLAVVVMLLLTTPLAMLIEDVRSIWPNIKFWAIVAAAWGLVFLAVSYT